MKTLLIVAAAGALALGCSGAPPPKTVDQVESPAPPPTDVAPPALPSLVQFDLDQLQGSWEAKGVRAFKEIVGKRETVTYYDRNRRVRSRHTADLELLRGLDDTVRVIAWSNLRTLVGKAPPETSGAYVYNCDGDRLVEYGGSLGELSPRSSAYAVVWRRVGAGAAPAPRATTPAARPSAPSAGGRDDKLNTPAGTGGAQHAMEGMAAWYGNELAGKPTASGEPFDPKALTAAHRTLPFGTRVQVTSLDTNKTVVVRINDRGPFKEGVIDLSRAAAEQIGLVRQGRGRVRLAVVN